MKRIYKYPLNFPNTTLEVPRGSRVLTVQVQRGVPCVWIECDPDAELTRLSLQVFGTGHAVPDGLRYVSTIQEADGALVWHFYQEKEEAR